MRKSVRQEREKLRESSRGSAVENMRYCIPHCLIAIVTAISMIFTDRDDVAIGSRHDLTRRMEKHEGVLPLLALVGRTASWEMRVIAESPF
ncbi:hypothetical protein PUN28_011368 [Cardiocondyla obscurior]|uniref:Uncharacterized protein n=1 Tax=Cardiocondyla obscurior TaxID=286306 RepID=A0AAW2FHY8_9HYME